METTKDLDVGDRFTMEFEVYKKAERSLSAAPLKEDGTRAASLNYFEGTFPVQSIVRKPPELTVGMKFSSLSRSQEPWTIVSISDDYIVATSPSENVTPKVRADTFFKEYVYERLAQNG